MSPVIAANLGFPQIGKRREVKSSRTGIARHHNLTRKARHGDRIRHLEHPVRVDFDLRTPDLASVSQQA
jgi:hypothetical protein